MKNQTYHIQTPRLILRCWQPADAAMLKQAVDESRAHLKPWMLWARDEPDSMQVQTERMQRFQSNFEKGIDFVYGIFNLDEAQVLGGTGLHTRIGGGAREIGYWIHKDHIGKGLATEVTSALMRVAFEVEGISRIEIQCDAENHGSAAIPKKLGFQHLETIADDKPGFEGRFNMRWEMLVENFHKIPAAKVEIKAFDKNGKQVL